MHDVNEMFKAMADGTILREDCGRDFSELRHNLYYRLWDRLSDSLSGGLSDNLRKTSYASQHDEATDA